VPVSGPFGMGEYARSLAVAQACIEQWPQAQLHFVLSRQAPYAAGVPFPSTLLDSSPTFHPKAVIELIASFRPTVVIFDNAGRTAQLRAARRGGARVVYISARARQRRKAFRWRWLNLIDEHWIAYPEFVAGALSFFERLKLRMYPGVRIRYLDVMLSQGKAPVSTPAVFPAGSFLLMVPGGGTGHPRARDAVGQFQLAASELAAAGIATLLIGAAEAPRSAVPLQVVASLPQPVLAQLLRDARLVVANGGSTLLQAIACGAACIAVPIAQDQAARIRHCVDAAVAVAAPLDANDIVMAATRLWRDETARTGLAQRARELKLADGVQVAILALKALH
jgi:UDP:flavonoid glycosyltransferase YjiC (YdhE family)